jgi:hypothetical protein
MLPVPANKSKTFNPLKLKIIVQYVEQGFLAHICRWDGPAGPFGGEIRPSLLYFPDIILIYELNKIKYFKFSSVEKSLCFCVWNTFINEMFPDITISNLKTGRSLLKFRPAIAV